MAALDRSRSVPEPLLPAVPVRRHRHRRRALGLTAVWAVVLANAAAIVWLWIHGGNLTLRSSGDALTSIARLTGLLSAYLALIQVILLARVPALERLAGFDRLSVWHRWNGHACLDLVLAHVVFSVWGYALLDRFSLPKEISTMLGGGIYPGMITATVGTALLVAVVVTSVVIVKRRLRYEWWYSVHLLAYAGIALAWFHQIPTGNELVLNTIAADYWRALYVATIALLVVFRVVAPALAALRYRLRVAAVVEEGPGVVSLWITGRRLERLQAQAGQFFLWRFLTRGRWSTAHPFSLSAAPDGRSLRITVKTLGDHTARMGEVPIGTRVVAEGPFGVFTDGSRRREKVLLIAGGIGITPVRALLQQMRGDVVVVYRVVSDADVLFRRELDELARASGAELHYVVGDHTTDEGRRHLSPGHLRELVPDIADRDVYVCGPPALTDIVTRHVREAGVRRSHIHAERFAL
ncbi:MAG: ferredoxin reductase family protein [Gaiellaceae bacterium]